MNNAPMWTLAVYSIAVIAASLLGGWLPSLVRMTHTRTQLVMSSVAGLMLGVAMYHLLPHGLTQLRHSQLGGRLAIDVAVWWAMLGMILMLLLLRLFHFHQHDFSHEEEDHHDHHNHPLHGSDHGGAHPGGAHPGGAHPGRAHPLSWLGIALGLGLHTLIDGIALGASVTSHVGEPGFGWIGLGVFLAILLHKPLDAMSITSMMHAGGWSSRARSVANLVFATLCPLGALLFVLGTGVLDDQAFVVGCALAFSAGVFLCISLGDLLPEVHFHSHDRVKLTVAFLLGIGLAYALRFLEPGLAHSLSGVN